jgi:hypothetical protein
MDENHVIKIEQNVRKKILWPLGIAFLISFSLFLIASNYFMSRDLNRTLETQLQTQTKRYHNYIQERTGLMRSLLQQLSRDRIMINALIRQDRPLLLKHSTPLFNELLAQQHITHFYYHKPNGINLLRVHKPDFHGDRIDRVTMHMAKLNDSIIDGVELGPLGTFTLRVVMPIHHQSRVIGYIELGEEIGPILDYLSAENKDKFAILILKKLLNRDAWTEGRHLLHETAQWDLLPDHVVSGTDDPAFIKALPRITTKDAVENALTVEIDLNNKTYQGRFLNMLDFGGRSVGSLLILQDVHEIIKDHETATLLFIIFILLLAVALFWISSNILGRADRNLRLASEYLTEEGLKDQNRSFTIDQKPATNKEDEDA